MYKDHVVKALLIIFIILLCFFLPFLFLKLFYGRYFTFVFGDMFSKIFTFIKYGYYGYVYISPTKHSSAMLGVYFYIVLFLFLSMLAFLLVKFFLKADEKDIKDYCIKSDKKNKFSLDVLDDKKRLGE